MYSLYPHRKTHSRLGQVKKERILSKVLFSTENYKKYMYSLCECVTCITIENTHITRVNKNKLLREKAIIVHFQLGDCHF